MLEPRDQTKNKSTPAKILTVLVVGILLGLGLCGTGAAISDHFPNAADHLFAVGAISFWISLLGLILTALILFLFGLGKKDR